jgi:hypothetical protein
MARQTEIELKFLADLGDLQKQLADMPGIGADAAKKLVKEMTSQYKKAKSASDKLARDLKDNSEKMGKSLDGAKNAAEGLGGVFGETAGRVEKMLQATVRLGAGFGPVGAAIGAATVSAGLFGGAAIGATVALVDFVKSADELIERQEGFDAVFGALDPGDVEDLHNFADALDGLGVIAERVHVLIGADLARALGETTLVAVKLGLVFEDVIQKFDLGVPILRAMAAAFGIGEGTILAATVAIDAISAATESYDDEARALLGTVREEKVAEDGKSQSRKTGKSATDAAKKAEQEYREEVQRLSTAFREQQAAQDALLAIIKTNSTATMSEVDKVNAKYDEQIDKIAELSFAAKDAEMVRIALHSAEMARMEEIGQLTVRQLDEATQQTQAISEQVAAIRQQNAEAFAEMMGQLAQYTTLAGDIVSSWSTMLEQFHQDELDRIESEANARKNSFNQWKESEKERINRLLETGKITAEQHAEMIAQYDEQRERRKKGLDDQLNDLSAAAKKEFKGMKQAQRARIIAEGAAAIIAMTAQMASFLGPGAPLAAAAIMGPLIDIQLRQVNKQEPPEFPMGGLVSERMGMEPARGTPDHVLVGVRPDERILSPGESARMGGTVITLQLDRRTIAEAVADASGTGYLAPMAGRIAGRSTIYGRG